MRLYLRKVGVIVFIPYHINDCGAVPGSTASYVYTAYITSESVHSTVPYHCPIQNEIEQRARAVCRSMASLLSPCCARSAQLVTLSSQQKWDARSVRVSFIEMFKDLRILYYFVILLIFLKYYLQTPMSAACKMFKNARNNVMHIDFWDVMTYVHHLDFRQALADLSVLTFVTTSDNYDSLLPYNCKKSIKKGLLFSLDICSYQRFSGHALNVSLTNFNILRGELVSRDSEGEYTTMLSRENEDLLLQCHVFYSKWFYIASSPVSGSLIWRCSMNIDCVGHESFSVGHRVRIQ